MELENRPDVPDEDLTRYEGIPATSVWRSLEDLRDRSYTVESAVPHLGVRRSPYCPDHARQRDCCQGNRNQKRLLFGFGSA